MLSMIHAARPRRHTRRDVGAQRRIGKFADTSRRSTAARRAGRADPPDGNGSTYACLIGNQASTRPGYGTVGAQRPPCVEIATPSATAD